MWGRKLDAQQRMLKLSCYAVVAASLLCCCGATSGSTRLQGFKPLSAHVHPSLLCVGAAKAGTTDLHKALLTLLPKHFNKPTGFMNDGKEILMLQDPEFASNQSKHTEYYERLAVNGPAPFTLDFSPLYLWSDKAPQNAAQVLPNGTSTMVMLRDPVSHLISFINWRKGDNGKRLVKDLDAGEVLLAEMLLLQQPHRYRQLTMAAFAKDALQGHELYLDLAAEVDKTLGEVFGPRFTNRRQGYVTASIVLTGLRNWLEGFARPNQTLVILSDAWFANRTDVWYNALMPFMFGDDERDWPVLHDSNWLSTEEPALKQNYAKEVPEWLRCALHTFYQPFVCMLEQLLQTNPAVTVYPPNRLDGSCRPWGPKSDSVAECQGLPEEYRDLFERLHLHEQQQQQEKLAGQVGGSTGSGSTMSQRSEGAARQGQEVDEAKQDAQELDQLRKRFN